MTLRVRDLLEEAGLDAFRLTSGSKRTHLYVRLDKGSPPLAQSPAQQTPDLVTTIMKRGGSGA